VRIGIDASKRTIVEKKKDTDMSGISIGIIGIVHSLSIVGRKTSSFLLSEIVLSAMVMIGMTDPIGVITIMIADSMDRLGEEHLFMIGWRAGSVCTTGSAIVLDIFPGTRKNLRGWLMHGSPMSLYSTGMPILIRWSQGKVIVHR